MNTPPDSAAQPTGLSGAGGSGLWVVRCEKHMVVVAGSSREAEATASQYLREDDGEHAYFAYEVRSAGDMPREWRGLSIPWGGNQDDERSCVERLLSPNK